MRILIDTNIVIHLEDSSSILNDSFSELVRLATENKHQLLIHHASQDDIRRDTNEGRKAISLSRIKKYSTLEHPPLPDKTELERLGLSQVDDNDRVDNNLLYAIYKDAANILITEDRGIHKKAISLSIDDRVHYVQQATEFLRRLYARVPVSLPNIEEVSLHQIDLNSAFFDSLREDYPEFNTWFRKSSREGRKAWVHKNEVGQLGAIVIYKEENDPIITKDNKGLPGRVLKLCTFKVGEEIRGRKIGELLLKAAFRYATNNGHAQIYITMRPGKQDFLEDLCIDFGFNYFGENKRDYVYVKDHPITPPAHDIDALEYHKRYYPHFKCGSTQKKFIVPIIPAFHEILFPDIQEQPNLFVHSTVGNAIKQAYLCHARIGGISPGDILLFYRSRDLQGITSIGIVESSHEFKEADKIMQLVSKRTVYSYTDIVKMAKKKTKVILFRLADHLSEPVRYDWLKKQEVVNGPIQTIRRISDESFQRVVHKGSIRNCFYAD